MPLPSRLLPSIALLALLAGASAAALAAPQQGRRRPPPAEQSQERPQHGNRGRDSLSESIRRAERDTHGQVLSAERVPYDGRSINRIKVVDDSGRVRIYMDDPRQHAMSGQGSDGDGRRRRGSGAASTRDDDD